MGPKTENTNATLDSRLSTRDRAIHRGRRLEYLTIAWNSLEAVVSIIAGFIAGSIALVGFGLDSVIETSSGAVMLWRFHGSNERDAVRRERAERIALRLVGLSFLALAAYVLIDAGQSLITREAPDSSVAGIIIAALSLVVMPVLARSKRRVASALDSGAMQADSRQTDICAYLSAILLLGLGLNAAFGWWWADPVAGLIMVPIIAKEGIEAVQGKTCACHDGLDPATSIANCNSSCDCH
ncbi:MAG TPA: cation transporter [Clostridia bacterium]|nr:cation transporter [Clostridia bacterium]